MNHKLLASVVMAFLCSCAGPTAVQHIPMPDQSVAIEHEGSSRIYFVRRNQTYGSMREFNIHHAGVLIGSISEGDYLCWEAKPGQAVFRVVFKRRPIDGGDIEVLTGKILEAGETYYYAVGAHAKGSKPTVEAIPAGEGRAMLDARIPAPYEAP